MGYNEYCKNCVWFDWRKKWCNNHKKHVAEFDTCRAFKRSD